MPHAIKYTMTSLRNPRYNELPHKPPTNKNVGKIRYDNLYWRHLLINSYVKTIKIIKLAIMINMTTFIDVILYIEYNNSPISPLRTNPP